MLGTSCTVHINSTIINNYIKLNCSKLTFKYENNLTILKNAEIDLVITKAWILTSKS